MGNRLNQGFSLIELMVAMSLLSIIVFVGSMSYSTFMGSWNKVNSQINSNIKKAKHLMLLRKSVNSTMSFALRDSQDKAGLLFLGNENSFTSITGSGVFNDKFPAFYKMKFELNDEDTDSTGVGKLTYQEASSENTYHFNTSRPLNFTHEIILLKNIYNFKIVYLGWPNYQDKLQMFDEESQPKAWVSEYNAFQSSILPEAISIKFTDHKDEQHILYFDLLDGSEKLMSRALGADNDA